MPNSLITATLPNVNGLVEDEVVNAFAIRGLDAGATAPQISGCLNAIKDFYTGLAAGQVAQVGAYLSDSISRAALACTLKAYDITGFEDGTPHGSPFASATFTMTDAGDSNQLPHEVAFVATLEALGRDSSPVTAPDGADPDALIDRPKQRHTGRIYLGPVCQFAVDSLGAQARPKAQFMTDVRLAVDKIDSDLFAAGAFGLGVWSRKDAIVRQVVAVSTDDAWDTQRRRGVAATARTRLTI